MEFNSYIIHYAEVALKRGNRTYFEKKLVKNIQRATKDCGPITVDRRWGRILLYITPDVDIEKLNAALKRVFGIAYFSPCLFVDQDVDAISEAAVALTENEAFESFRVATRRANKLFPMKSPDLNAHVGSKVWEKSKAKVDLKNAEMVVNIEIFDEAALVYVGRVDGEGGLPVGVSGKAITMLSSGIDSPVAAYKLMRRGVRIAFVHFHSAPYTSTASKRNAEKLVEILTQFQFTSVHYNVPFLEIQQHIISIVPASYRVIMYRRAMFRLAERIAHRERAKALVTGENIAQVASQTLPNIAATSQVVEMPIFRPLCAYDKKDIIAEARRIGTYETSTEPYEDCCTLFVPEHPETNAKLDKVIFYESKLDLDKYLDKAMENVERLFFKF